VADRAVTRAPAAGPFPPAPRRSVGVIMIGSALSLPGDLLAERPPRRRRPHPGRPPAARASGGDAGLLDLAGLGLAAGGTTGLTYGLAQIGTRAEPALAAIAPLAAGTGLLAAFVLASARIARPLPDVRRHASRAFTAASVTSFSLGAAMFGGMIQMPLYSQVVHGQDVIATGLLLAPSGAGRFSSTGSPPR
jgi:hypothetical protein